MVTVSPDTTRASMSPGAGGWSGLRSVGCGLTVTCTSPVFGSPASVMAVYSTSTCLGVSTRAGATYLTADPDTYACPTSPWSVPAALPGSSTRS